MNPSFSRRAARLASIAALAVCTVPALAGVTIGGSVDVTIQQPGVYGRVVLGTGLPLPPVVLPQPVVVTPGPVARHAQPVYLYVPPGHQKHWSKHCHRYDACNQNVYFVREDWVRERYEQEHRHDAGHKPPPVNAGHRDDRDDDDGHGHRGRGHDKGHDKGHGNKGRGKGHG